MMIIDNIIADMLSNKKYNPVVTELLMRGRKLKISFICILCVYVWFIFFFSD